LAKRFIRIKLRIDRKISTLGIATDLHHVQDISHPISHISHRLQQQNSLNDSDFMGSDPTGSPGEWQHQGDDILPLEMPFTTLGTLVFYGFFTTAEANKSGFYDDAQIGT